jgi:hypothetical protein
MDLDPRNRLSETAARREEDREQTTNHLKKMIEASQPQGKKCLRATV